MLGKSCAISVLTSSSRLTQETTGSHLLSHSDLAMLSMQITASNTLLLLGSSAEADMTDFWFVFYVQPNDWWPEIHVINVCPPERFDFPSRQLRTAPIPQKYYNLNRFKIIDGIIEVQFVTTHPFHVELSTKLLVGRQASSRRQTPEPWCQFADFPEPQISPAEFMYHYEAQEPAPTGLQNTSQKTSGSYRHEWVRASVREKEISGVGHYLVAVEFVRKSGPADENTFVLQREDPHDRRSQATGDNGRAEPLRL